MKISYFADVFELTDQLIPGLLDHWRPLVPEDTEEARRQRFRAHMNRDQLPIGWLAHDGDRALGTASLRVSDLPGREELTPWLGGVYVVPELRRRGIASALCRAVEERARELGFRRLHLFTLDQQPLYAHLGWRATEQSSWKGRAATLMTKALDRERGAVP